NEEFGRSPKQLPIKRRGDMPCPADLQRRPDRVIYDPVTVSFTLRRKSSVKAFRDKSRLQNPNHWRQHAVKGFEPAFGGEVRRWNIHMGALPERVHSGVGPSRTRHGQASPANTFECFFEAM